MAQRTTLISPVQEFFDPSKGRALAGGTLYIGAENSDPKNDPLDRYNVYNVNDDGTEILISQPIPLNGAGQPSSSSLSGNARQIRVELPDGVTRYCVQAFSNKNILALYQGSVAMPTGNHQLLTNRNAVGAHDASAITYMESGVNSAESALRDRAVYMTIAEAQAATLEVGQYVRLVDRADGLFLVQPVGLVADGFGIVGRADGTSIEVQNINGEANIRHYGANESLSNCAPNVNAAIKSNLPVFAPSGTYNFTDKIDVFSNSTIFGSGQKETIFQYGGSGDFFDFSVYNAQRVNIKNIGVRSGELDPSGYGTASTTTRAFFAHASRYNKFTSVDVYGFDKAFDFGVNSWVEIFYDVEITACNTGIVGNGEFNDVVFNSGVIHSCKQAMDIGAGRGVFVQNSWIELNKKGIRKVNEGTIFINNNYIERNEDYCIRVDFGLTAPDLVSIASNDFFTTLDNYNFIEFHGNPETKIKVDGSYFKYFSDTIPVPSSCYAVSASNIATKARLYFDTSNKVEGCKIQNPAVESKDFFVLTGSESMFDSDIHYPVGDGGASINIATLIERGNYAFRFYTSQNCSLILPSLVNSERYIKPIKFFYTGADAVTFDTATNNCTIVNIQTLTPNKIWSLHKNRIISGTTTEYILIDG